MCFCVYVYSQAQAAQIGGVQNNPGGFFTQGGGFLLKRDTDSCSSTSVRRYSLRFCKSAGCNMHHYYYCSYCSSPPVCELLAVLFWHQLLLWSEKFTMDCFTLPLVFKLLYISNHLIPLGTHETYFYVKTILCGPLKKKKKERTKEKEKCLPREVLWFS